jgi:hypothetical protein
MPCLDAQDFLPSNRFAWGVERVTLGDRRMGYGMQGIAAAAIVAAFVGGPVLATDDFSIVGVYMQNMACKGDGTDPVARLVRITETDIHSSFGICKFVKKQHEGNTLAAQMACDGGPGGNVLLGDVRFTVRDDKNIDVVDQDNTYRSVLYRCPSGAVQHASPAAASSR